MKRRRTKARAAIAVELLARRDAVHWGYELSRNAGVGAGSMYPFLSDLLEQGFLEDGWEDLPHGAGRPARRYYRLTDDGIGYLRDFLGAASPRVRGSASSLRPRRVEQ
ncbi:MAG: PadR family transcriptional regulator [Nocardioides sp.]